MFSDRIEIVLTRVKYSEEEKLFEINNSMIISQQDIGISIDFIYNAAINFSNSLSEKKPSKKVFISRKYDNYKDNSENRNINQDEVEDFFRSMGFEVIYGEGFSSLKEQMGFFNEVAVFAGFTGSGLTSSMFMQPGQTLIEIVCPLKFGVGQVIEYEIHNFYKTISMLKKHRYLAISNINNNKEDLLKDLKDLSKIL
jgi:capsular polysaccharide biosynthesis protein